MMGIFFYRDWIVLFLSRSDRFSFVFSYSFSSYYHLENDGTRDCIQGDWRRKRADEHKTRAPAKPRFGRRFNCALLVYLSCSFGPNRTRDFKRVLSNQFALGGRRPASKPLIRVTSARVHVKELPFSCFLCIFFSIEVAWFFRATDLVIREIVICSARWTWGFLQCPTESQSLQFEEKPIMNDRRMGNAK